MRFSYISILSPFLLVGFTAAYDSNCEGSLIPLQPDDCVGSIANIDTSATYTDGHEFSSGHCYLKYATNGSGPQPLSGQKIKDVANAIISGCSGSHGSYGTGNCDKCHVTVNYRS